MSDLSKKYTYLKQAETAGIITPKTRLLVDAKPENITDFINECDKESRYIIRSIQSSEDTQEQSFAGHFWSSSAVLADEIRPTIETALKENQQRLKQLKLTESPQLMLQEYIEHSIGGVLFSPWSFFNHYSFIEYSTHSVQDAVEGKTQPAVIGLKEGATSPLALPDTLGFLTQPLASLSQKLHNIFDFPVDSEWVYSEKKQSLVLLQVRPQTRLVGAVFTANTKSQPPLKLATGDWQYTALSESLGKLSPLSFSLLKQLYDDTKPSLQSLGYQAKQVDFMVCLPDGGVLVDAQRETSFYALTTFGGFWRSFKAPQWQQKISQFLQQHNVNKPFSYQQLSLLFQYWIIANVLSNGKGREEMVSAHAYELSWQKVLARPIIHHDLKTWAQLNPHLKQRFFFELEKLKQQLADSPDKALMSWQDYSNGLDNTVDEVQAATMALYDYSAMVMGESPSNTQSIGAKKKASGKLFIVENPNRLQQAIPAGSIIIAPCFDNQWVQSISQLSGIIVKQGGQLSHSAIVAREAGVPYFINPQLDLEVFPQGAKVELSVNGELVLAG